MVAERRNGRQFHSYPKQRIPAPDRPALLSPVPPPRSAVLGLLPHVLVQLHDDPPGMLHPMSCLVEAVGEQPAAPAPPAPPAQQPPQPANPAAGGGAAAAGEAAPAGSAAAAEPAAAQAASGGAQGEPPAVEQRGSGSVVSDTLDGAVAVRLTLFASGEVCLAGLIQACLLSGTAFGMDCGTGL